MALDGFSRKLQTERVRVVSSTSSVIQIYDSTHDPFREAIALNLN
jgi:hypothetical protein